MEYRDADARRGSRAADTGDSGALPAPPRRRLKGRRQRARHTGRRTKNRRDIHQGRDKHAADGRRAHARAQAMNALASHQDSRPALELSASAAPLLERKDHDAPSIFRPENRLREARRQKSLNAAAVPAICVIDPDGDIVTHVRRVCAAAPCESWACFHTRMWEWTASDVRCGIIGHVVGGSFSVLVAEQLFVSGCELLVNIASAGQIINIGRPPYYILIERALRDEGTSYHYLPPSADDQDEVGRPSYVDDLPGGRD